MPMHLFRLTTEERRTLLWLLFFALLGALVRVGLNPVGYEEPRLMIEDTKKAGADAPAWESRSD